MTDIVDRLRDLAAIDNCQASLEAADEIERLRAALENCWTAAAEHHTENVSRCEWSGSSIAQKKARAIAARSGVLLHNIKTIARAALEGRT